MGTAIAVAVVVAAVVSWRRGQNGGAEPAAAPATEVAGRSLNRLVGKAGAVAGQTFHIGYRTVTIGRGTTNFIQVTDEDASRKPCQLTPREGWSGPGW